MPDHSTPAAPDAPQDDYVPLVEIDDPTGRDGRTFGRIEPGHDTRTEASVRPSPIDGVRVWLNIRQHGAGTTLDLSPGDAVAIGRALVEMGEAMTGKDDTPA